MARNLKSINQKMIIEWWKNRKAKSSEMHAKAIAEWKELHSDADGPDFL